MPLLSSRKNTWGSFHKGKKFPNFDSWTWGDWENAICFLCQTKLDTDLCLLTWNVVRLDANNEAAAETVSHLEHRGVGLLLEVCSFTQAPPLWVKLLSFLITLQHFDGCCHFSLLFLTSEAKWWVTSFLFARSNMELFCLTLCHLVISGCCV